jgi:hypothetical protein
VRVPAWVVVLVIALAVALWQVVFVVTGLGGSAALGPPVARPAPVPLPTPPTDWIDLDLYRRTHPTWQPR